MKNYKVLIYFAIISQIHCLYEDQVGKFDWRHQYVGNVKFGKFEESEKSLPRRFYVATEQNVLASLNFVTGDLMWRQVFERGNTGRIDDFLARKDDLVCVSGAENKIVRSFESSRGNSRWEWATYEPKLCSQASKLVELGSKIIALLTCNRIVALDDFGAVVWATSLKHENVKWADVAYLSKRSQVVIIVKTDRTTHLLKIDSKNGNVLAQQQFNDVANFEKCGIFEDAQIALCLDPSNGLLRAISLGDFTEFPTTTLPSFSNQIQQFVKTAPSLLAVIDSASVARIFSVKQDGSLTEIGGPHQKVVSVSSVQFENNLYIVLATCDDACEIRWFDAVDGRPLTQANIVIRKTSEINGITKVFPLVFSKIDHSTGYRAVVVGFDHSVAALQPSGKPFWVRQEALASIVSIEMIDLPLSEAQASVESEFSTGGKNFINMFSQRIVSQARQIHRGVLRLLNESLVLMGAVGSSSDWLSLAKSVTHENENAALERDYFNLHKLIVVVTSVGKAFGLDSRRGKIVWQFFDDKVEPFSSADKQLLPLFVQRTTAHYPFPAQCVIVGREKNTGFARILFFDPIAGRVVNAISLNRQIKQAALLPFATADELFGLILLTNDEKIYVYPTELEKDLAETYEQKPFYFFTADYSTGLCEGYKLGRQISRERSSTDEFLIWSSERVWNFLLPLEKGGSIVDIKMKRQHEHVHSQGRVLGDRSVLYKYSNPNLVAAAIKNMDESGKGTLSIYLFDAVTGATVFSVVQRRVAPPFHVVHCENWLVYSFWNEKSRRTEFSVLEMYEGKSQSDPDKFSSLVARPAPMVMRQAYVFPHGVNAMAVTDTEKGITSRHLLVALPFGGILELHKAFLDPRRVLMPTPEEREEGLIPYMPDLPIATEHLINYNQSVLNIRAIFTAPAGLESTSLVLAYGLDLFYTRVNPSATFDILKDDFDHWFISLMLLGLFLASVLTKKLARHRDLKLAWK